MRVVYSQRWTLACDHWGVIDPTCGDYEDVDECVGINPVPKWWIEECGEEFYYRQSEVNGVLTDGRFAEQTSRCEEKYHRI